MIKTYFKQTAYLDVKLNFLHEILEILKIPFKKIPIQGEEIFVGTLPILEINGRFFA